MRQPIRVAIASGKGGTGKTTIATSLAVALADAGTRVGYIDCDVEEPNGHIFLRPDIHLVREVSIPVPEVDASRCTWCGACAKACRYSAILVLPKQVLTFPKLCHGCGGCSMACPEGAIREVPRVTGVVEEGVSGRVIFRQGKLNIGEAMAPPVIRAALDGAPESCTLVLDAPPGTSCPVIESVKAADVVLLVSEPTPFGLNDLMLAAEMVREVGLPFGVAVNRVGTGDNRVRDYCAREQIPVLLEVPNDRGIAEAYSRGELAVAARPQLGRILLDSFEKLSGLIGSASKRPRVRSQATTMAATVEPDGRPSEAQRPGRRDDVRELVVISGKGGTGKTSIVASFFALASQASVADCDVDAADLHLILDPAVRRRWPFSATKTAVIDAERCTGCGICSDLCRFGAIRAEADVPSGALVVDPISREGCGVCADACPENAVVLVDSAGGEWFVSDTRHGPMVHARLGIAQGNSGRLVSLVRREAKVLSSSRGREQLICDGSPGIGCPVIASIAGAQMVLVVAEPTLSGLHDFERVAELCRQFHVTTGVCINKADINPEISDHIEVEAARRGLLVLGRIRYDESVTAAQMRRMAAVENGDGPASADIRALWERVKDAAA